MRCEKLYILSIQILTMGLPYTELNAFIQFDTFSIVTEISNRWRKAFAKLVIPHTQDKRHAQF